MIVIGLRNGTELAVKLAKELKSKYSPLFIHEFPDGEFKLRYDVPLRGQDVVLVQSLSIRPNDYLVELLIAIETAKQLGATKVTVVLPYLCYARQDVAFQPGEGISAFVVTDLINYSGADEVYTVMTHIHRVPTLRKLFHLPGENVAPFQEMANWISKNANLKDVVLVGPDWESKNVVDPVANILRVPVAYFEKVRSGNRKVKQTLKGTPNVKGKTAVILDDTISTGMTIQGAAQTLKKLGVKKIMVGTVHLMGDEGAKRCLKLTKLFAASDSIPNKYVKFSCASSIAKAMQKN